MIAHKELQRAVLALRKLTDPEMDQEASITVHALKKESVASPENVEFIKSEITELIKRKLEEENILPPIPAFMRKEFLEGREHYFRMGAT